MYFLHGAFKVLSSVVFWFDSARLPATTEDPEDLITLYVMRVQKRKRVNLLGLQYRSVFFGLFMNSKAEVKNLRF